MAPQTVLPRRASQDVQEILSGGRGVTAVRGLLERPQLLGWRLVRSKYKPGRKLTGSYVASSPPGEPDRWLVVTWSAADGQAALLRFPDDPSMPELGRLSRPEHLAHVADALDGSVPSAAGTPSVAVLRYRPGQRHVLRLDRGAGGPPVFVKADRDGSGARSVPVAGAIGSLLAERTASAGTVLPIGWVPEDRAAFWAGSAGCLLRQTLTADLSQAARRVATLGRAVRVLHDVQPSSVADTSVLRLLDTRDVDDELAATRRAGEHVVALLPAQARAYDGLLAQVRQALDRCPAEGPRLTHGDLKTENVLVLGDTVRLLDLDRVCWSDPALDLAKLRADLRWWCLPDGHRLRVLDAAFRDGYGDCDPARWVRASVLTALFQLRLAARRCAVDDPAWAGAVRRRLVEAATGAAEGIG